MLETMRKYATGVVAQVLIAMLVLSFAIWGVSDIFRGFGGNVVAEVGNREISSAEFDFQYRQSVNNFAQQIGQAITPDQAQALGIPGSVLGRLVAQAALDQEAGGLGLSLSDAKLAQQISADPFFRGLNGAFDRNAFASRINQLGYNEGGYLVVRRSEETRKQLGAAVSGGLTAPEAYRRALHEYENESRNIRYLVLTRDLVGDVGEPTPEQLTTFFEANKASWQAPETRRITTLSLNPQLLADPATIGDDELKAAYDERLAQYSSPETRHVWQIVFADRAAADAAAAKLASGTPFEELGEDVPTPVDLGVVTKDRMIDPALAEAAFAAEDGKTTPVVDGRFGPAIAKVAEITPPATKPLEEVRDELRRALAEEHAADLIPEIRDRVEDARAGGDALDKIAADLPQVAAGLRTVVTDASGKDESGADIADLPGGQALIADAFESDVGLANAPVEPAINSYVWYDVDAINPARDRTVDEVREKLTTAWKNDAARTRLDTLADELAERLRGGEAIDAIATEKSLTVGTADALTRSATPDAPLSRGVVAAAFGGPQGHVATTPGADDATRIVLQVAGVELSAYFSGAPNAASAEQQLGTAIGNDLLQGYVTDLQARAGVSVNEALVAQVIGAGT